MTQENKDYKFDDRKDKLYKMTPNDKNIITNSTWSDFTIQFAKQFFGL